MLRVERHDDVTRLELASPASRLVGYTASAHLVDTADGGVLVDTGPPFGWRSLRRALREISGGEIARAVRGAIVTHAHEDHAGNVAPLARAAVPLAMGAPTREAIRRVGPIAAYRRLTWGAMAPLPPDAASFDPAPLVLLPTPGHTRDHHTVWDPGSETLFGGDLFLGVQVRIAHPSEDLRALADSLRRMAALRPRRLFDAHRGLVEQPAAKLTAKAAWLDDTVGEVERLLDRGWTTRRVRDQLLGGESAVGVLSRGDYSREGFVRAVQQGRERAVVG